MKAKAAAVVQRSGVGSLLRRLRTGRREVSQADQEIISIAESGLFDESFYKSRYPDVVESGIDPLTHYVRHGAEEGRLPCSWFDTGYYLASNPDVAASGMNPFRHYCDFGKKEQRPFGRTAKATSGKNIKLPSHAVSDARDQYATILHSGLFDRDFYLSSYPSVARAGVDPIEHYLEYGSGEGRNPSAHFDTLYYLKNNHDVASNELDPLTHFCIHGWEELRSPCANFDMPRYWLSEMAPQGLTGNPLVHYQESRCSPDLQIHSVSERGPLERNRMATQAEVVLRGEPTDTKVLQMLGSAMGSIGRWGVAEEAYRQLTKMEWGRAEHHVSLARALAAQKKWWLVIESLTNALQIDPEQPDLLFMLGDANERMNRFKHSANAFRQAVGASAKSSELHYRLGYVLQRDGDLTESDREYSIARDLAADESVRTYGVGVLHARRGLWEDAKHAYVDELTRHAQDGRLRHRLGMAHDRLYEWADAAQCYIDAITLNSAERMPTWHYRLGFVYERMDSWASAADAYTAAINLNEKHIPYWHYRLGYVLEKDHQLTEACSAWMHLQRNQELPPQVGLEAAPSKVDRLLMTGSDELESASEGSVSHPRYISRFSGVHFFKQALTADRTDAVTHYRLGEALEREGALEAAAQAYTGALARSSEHRPSWFFRLGQVFTALSRYDDACDAFRQTRVLQRPHGVSEDALKDNPVQLAATSYVEYSECLRVRDQVVLYESYNGVSISCNPLALFRKLLELPEYEGFLHVWVLNDLARIPEEYRSLENVVFVSKGSDGYLRHLATARYLVNNSGFPPYFIRRPEQKYLATWHGTPLKTLGKEQKYKFYDHKRTQRNYLQASHIITPNPHTTSITLDSYDIRPLYMGLFAETGYPRVDLMVSADDKRKQHVRSRLRLTPDKPVVLYAPTWRGTLEEVQFDVGRLRDDLQKLSARDCQVIFRGHSLLERVIQNDELNCVVVPPDVDTNELLSVVDVLITDYSSIFFDFMAAGKPILYYIYDVEEYERDRGLYFDMADMPGYKCENIDDLCSALDAAIETGMPDPVAFASAREKYAVHDDGKATARVIDFFFYDSSECVIDHCDSQRPALLMSGGSFAPNGITSSFVNLVRAINPDLYDVVVAFSPGSVELAEDNIAQFRKMPNSILAVPRYGSMPMTLEEGWVRKHSEDLTMRLGEEQQRILKRAFTREFLRIFGPKKYDATVSFAGYDAFWSSILINNELDMAKSIYLHNDMFAEYTGKYPELDRIFALYDDADSLVSVSKQTHTLNVSNLSARLGVPADKFVSCDNVINGPEIEKDAEREFEVSADGEIFEGSGPIFINIGRLSMEKDQEKLIRAFKPIAQRNSSARLLILGTGPLDATLHTLVDTLDLADNVRLLGYRRNPYPYLNASSCFVLSSNHEGQPMTLLEALVLGKPIVATDIVGNRSVLDNRGGLLVENSREGLTRGMERFLSGEVEVKAFDHDSYNRNAVAEFYACALRATRIAGSRATGWEAQAPSTLVNFFSRATSVHYLPVQDQLNGLVMKAMTVSGASYTVSEREYSEGAINFTWFIRQRADVLMSHGVADKNYYWMMDPKTGDRYLDRFKAVLVPGQWMKNRIVNSKKLEFRSQQVRVVGWPRLDLLREEQSRVPVPLTKDSINILWAPTHDARKRGPEQKSTSTFPEFEPFAKRLAEQYSTSSSLHPSNRDDKSPTLDKLLRANIVVSDFGTMVYEAWALGKVVIFPRWILGDRVQKYLPGSAEAYIFENNIGYHPRSFEEMVTILDGAPTIGADVHAFMRSYLDNYQGGDSAAKIAEVLISISSNHA